MPAISVRWDGQSGGEWRRGSVKDGYEVCPVRCFRSPQCKRSRRRILFISTERSFSPSATAMADKKRAGIELKLIDAKQSRPADGVARLGVDSQILGDRPSRHGSSRPPAADSSTLSLRTFSQSGPVRRPHDGQVGDSRASAHTGGHTGGPPAANQHTLRGATTPARSNAPLPLRFFAQSGPVRLAPGVPLSASIPTKPAETMQPTGPMNRAKVSI